MPCVCDGLPHLDRLLDVAFDLVFMALFLHHRSLGFLFVAYLSCFADFLGFSSSDSTFLHAALHASPLVCLTNVLSPSRRLSLPSPLVPSAFYVSFSVLPQRCTALV
jgi:hypothetical protein